MTIRPKFTKTQKKEMTSGWCGRVPGMKALSSMHLIRRHGPILLGLCLQTLRQDNEYQPRFHYFSLARDFPVVALEGVQNLLRTGLAPYAISALQHEASLERMIDAAQQQFPCFFRPEPSVDEVFEFIHAGNLKNAFAWASMQSEIMALYWLGRSDLVASRRVEYGELMENWPESVTQKFDGRSGWEADLTSKLDSDQIGAALSSQVDKFNLSSFTDFGFSD